jgi:hypothetical protein
MITDSTVNLYARTASTNTRGQVSNTYALSKPIQANVQPVSLTQATMTTWGALNLTADSKIMFFYPDSGVNLLDRILDSWGDTYEIRAINKWGVPPFGHYEALLVPVQGLA